MGLKYLLLVKLISNLMNNSRIGLIYFGILSILLSYHIILLAWILVSVLIHFDANFINNKIDEKAYHK